MARMSELKRAAQQLGVSSTLLHQQGWKTASPERIRAVADNPPDWLVEARDRRDVSMPSTRSGHPRFDGSSGKRGRWSTS